jgi:hypothetical protein
MHAMHAVRSDHMMAACVVVFAAWSAAKAQEVTQGQAGLLWAYLMHDGPHCLDCCNAYFVTLGSCQGQRCCHQLL